MFAKQNKGLVVKLVCLVAIVAGIVAYSAITATAQAEESANRATLRESGQRGPYLVDGAFTGRATSYGGPMDVTVTVSNGYITDIQIERTYDDSPYIDDVQAAKIPEIIDEQTYDLDVVTNASYSSHGLMNAVKNALRDGGAIQDEGSSTSSKKQNTTQALKARAQAKAAEEAVPWYELTFQDLQDQSNESTDIDKSGKLSGFAAGGK